MRLCRDVAAQRLIVTALMASSPGTRITFSFSIREKRGLLDRVFASSNPILVTHPAGLAVGEVDLEHVLRRADHTD